MKRLCPKLRIKNRAFYRKKVSQAFIKKKAILKQKLDKASWVCTTADSWTSRRKSFLGVTVHWLTPELKRVSGCLAIRRVIGKCDYEVLAKLLASNHEEFEVTKKVTATITDNGSNFVKAFRIYGASPDTQQTNKAVRNVHLGFYH